MLSLLSTISVKTLIAGRITLLHSGKLSDLKPEPMLASFKSLRPSENRVKPRR